MPSSLWDTLIGAFQGTVSVLLTLSAGYVVARHGLLARSSVSQFSKLCSVLFLPCLIIVQMGPELTARQLSDVWIVPLWGLVSTIAAHLIGWVGMRLFKFDHWTVVAAGRPNSNALPLLLLQSLQNTGVLDSLARPGEDIARTLQRAKSFVLLNAVVQQVITFQLAPRILSFDRAQNKDDARPDRLRPGKGRLSSAVQDPERVGLLHDDDEEDARGQREGYHHAMDDIADTPDVHWPHFISALEKPVKWVLSQISPPLIGAIIAFTIGVSHSALSVCTQTIPL